MIVGRQLRTALLGHPIVLYALLAIGESPAAGNASEIGQSTTERARRIYSVRAALCRVLSSQAIDRYDGEIRRRREDGTWPKCRPPLGSPVGGEDRHPARWKGRGPDSATIVTAGSALAACVPVARSGAQEQLDAYDRDELRRGMKFLGIDAIPPAGRGDRSNEPTVTRARWAARKRRRGANVTP